MKIGDVQLESPFVLAPLAGVSDSPFRQLAREQGAAAVYTEMVSSDGLVRGNKMTMDYIAFEPHERPIGVQLFGSDPAVMADATRVLSELPPEQRGPQRVGDLELDQGTREVRRIDCCRTSR